MPGSVRATHAGPEGGDSQRTLSAPKSACFIGAKGSRKVFVRHLSLKDKLKGSNLRAPDLNFKAGEYIEALLMVWPGV